MFPPIPFIICAYEAPRQNDPQSERCLAQFRRGSRLEVDRFWQFRLVKVGRIGWGTWIPAKTRVADQKPLACSAFVSSRGGRVGALWTITVDHSRRRRPAGALGEFNQHFGVDDPTATLGASYLQAIR